ncbi:hypothetical protein KY285_030300 [Solanum tuberosum]|nr:hypothetical protein KY285_030300 [Solanum tuberosum]
MSGPGGVQLPTTGRSTDVVPVTVREPCRGSLLSYSMRVSRDKSFASMARKGWRCMDPETKKLVTSIDVVFDEISSYHSAYKTSNQETILDGDQENFEQLPESNLQEPNNEGSSNSDDVERQIERRSIREKRQPSYFKDYEVQLNCCSNTSCFFTGVLDEPVSYEEAKGHPE